MPPSLNYFSNFMLKHLPHDFTAEMLERQADYLARLKKGETIPLLYCALVMRNGRIKIIEVEE